MNCYVRVAVHVVGILNFLMVRDGNGQFWQLRTICILKKINAILESFSLNICRLWIHDSLPKTIIQVQSGANYRMAVKLSLLHV